MFERINTDIQACQVSTDLEIIFIAKLWRPVRRWNFFHPEYKPVVNEVFFMSVTNREEIKTNIVTPTHTWCDKEFHVSLSKRLALLCFCLTVTDKTCGFDVVLKCCAEKFPGFNSYKNGHICILSEDLEAEQKSSKHLATVSILSFFSVCSWTKRKLILLLKWVSKFF